MLTPAILTVWALALAVYDWRRRRLPNWLLAFAWGIGAIHLAIRGTLPFGAAFVDGIGTAVITLLAFWPAYRAGWMGAGDVKLCATLGWLGGVKTLLAVLLIGTVASGLIALLLLSPSLSRYLSGGAVDSRLRSRIPYGAGLAIGFVAWMVAGMRAGTINFG